MSQRSLDGVKVVEFAFMGVTPTSTKILAINGATVIKVESSSRPDPLRTAGPFIDGIQSLDHSAEFANINNDKYGMAINTKKPEGIELAKKLLAWADIVADGFTTGAMARMGLGYEESKKINPDIIMISCNTFGQTGPYAKLASTGINLTGISGFNEITGWPDRQPLALGFYSDFIVPHFVLLTLLGALDYRRRTGKGQFIDISQLEAGIYFNSLPVLDYTANGRLWERQGNESNQAVPHAAYRCQGDDAWCAIAVHSDEEWLNFKKIIGNQSWINDERFSTFLGRKANEEELNELIEKWTIQYPAQTVMDMMQTAGVAAGIVTKGEDMFKDPQLKHYHYYNKMYFPSIKREIDSPLPFPKLSETPAQVRMPVPTLGQHTEYICTKMLGISDEEFVKLVTEGVLE